MSTPRIARCHSIARLTSPITVDEFHTHYVATNTPIILSLDSTTSSTDWSLPRLQSLLGPLTMNNVFRSTDGRYTYFDPKRQAGGTQSIGLQRQKMTFDEFVYNARSIVDGKENKEREAIQERKEDDSAPASSSSSSSRYYLYGEPLPNPLQSLLPPPTILTSISSLSSSLLWVAVDGSISPLHYDLSDGVLCQLHHSKHFLLFSPAHHNSLAPYPISHAHDRQSQLLFHTRPTLPLQAEDDVAGEGGLEAWMGEVRAGEMIYLPYGWWHQVESEGECVSVTYRWDDHQQQLQQLRAVSTHTAPALPACPDASLLSQLTCSMCFWLRVVCVCMCAL